MPAEADYQQQNKHKQMKRATIHIIYKKMIDSEPALPAGRQHLIPTSK